MSKTMTLEHDLMDALIYAMKDTLKDTLNIQELKLGFDLDLCLHKWKAYKGLTEEYNYCTVCDQKSGVSDPSFDMEWMTRE